MLKWVLLIVATTVWNGEKITHTDAEWREILGRDRYNVMRKKATERSYLGEYVNTEKEGIYHCAACDNPLFHSKDKFVEGGGWPSFSKPISKNNVYYLEDWSMGFKRYEVLCSKCDSHLGHIFNDVVTTLDDGTELKRLRYCINSIALKIY